MCDLALVDVVIRVDGVFAAQFSSQHLDGSVTDDLVDIHVRLSSRSCLPNHQREMIIQLPSSHLGTITHTAGVRDRLNVISVKSTNAAMSYFPIKYCMNTAELQTL